MSDMTVGSGVGDIDDIMARIDKATSDANDASGAVKAWVDKMNSLGWKDEFGNVLKFNTAAEWQKAWNDNRRWTDGSGHRLDQKALTDIRNPFDQAMAKANAAQVALKSLMDQQLAGENSDAANAIDAALQSGDIEGALMLVQVRRVGLLDKQLNAKVEDMKQRNAKIADLNAKLAQAQTMPAGADKDKTITGLQGDISNANNDSQLQMIGLQAIVNKRNEAFDTMTNLLGKFQKTMDNIVGNLR